MTTRFQLRFKILFETFSYLLVVVIFRETLNITSWPRSGTWPPGEVLVLKYLATFIKLTHPSQKVRIYAIRRGPASVRPTLVSASFFC